MEATLIATETTADGKEIKVFHTAGLNIAEQAVVDFFTSQMRSMVDDGRVLPRFLKNTKTQELIFAKVDEAVVGMIAFKDAPEGHVFMTMAAVEDGFKGTNIYNMMYEQFEKLARALGYTKISSLVDVSNATMLAACEKNGFSTKFLRIEKNL